MTKYFVERSIWINAPRERVWRAVTDPEQIQQWFSPAIPWKLSELAVGGVLYAVGYEQMAGHIITLDPPHQFAYMTAACPPHNVDVTTIYTLTEENGGTRVSINETGYEKADASKHEIPNNSAGYAMALENLRAYIHGEPLPYPEGF